MNKKIIVILSLLLGILGFIFTGVIGENATSGNTTRAEYCEFDSTIELIQTKEDGRKYLVTPEIEYGEFEKYYLVDYIRYDDNATQSIYEVSIVLDTNHPEMVTLGNFVLTIDCTSADLPGDLQITLTLSTNDGSNLTDKLFIVYDPSNLPIEIDPDF